MHASARWLKPFARAGYTSRGVVYLIIGFFALLSAFGPDPRKGSKGALRTVLEQPFGRALIVLMIIGLVGYVGWRLTQSLLDTDAHGWSMKGLAIRGGLLVSAATYTVLGVYALSLLGALSAVDDLGGDRSLADTIARYVGLKPVLMVLAISFAGVAVAHWNKALRRRYADHFDASDAVMRLVHPISIIGLSARGVVLATISVLLSLRFRKGAPTEGEPPGVADALAYLTSLPYGRWMVIATGIGLMLFAAYSFSEAVWRRINVEDAG